MRVCVCVCICVAGLGYYYYLLLLWFGVCSFAIERDLSETNNHRFLPGFPLYSSPSPARRTSLVKSTRGKSLVSKAGNDQIKETVDNLLTTATEKWEETEDKPAAVTLAAAGLVTLIVVSSLLGALDKVPFLGSILELVGIGYSAYFAYNNLLFTPDREKLASKVNEIKDKVL